MHVSSIQRSPLTKNLLWKLFGYIFGGGFYFLANLLLIRHLGPTLYGQWAYAMGSAGLLMILVDYGFNPLITRDISKTPGLATSYFYLVSLSKVFLWIAATAALLLIAFFQTSHENFISLLFCAALVLGATSFVDMGLAFTHALEEFKLSAILSSTHKLFMSIFLIIGIVIHRNINGLMTLLAMGALIGGLITMFYFYQRFNDPFTDKHFNVKTTYLWREGLPLLIQNVFIVVYFRIDTVMLTWLAGEKETGIYSAAYRFFELSNLFPSALIAISIASLSRAVVDGYWKQHFSRVLLRFSALGGLITGGLFLLSYLLGSFFLGKTFNSSEPILRILSGASFFYCSNFLLINFLVLIHKQIANVWISFLCVIVNIAGNLFAIPRWGASGAAWMTLIVEMVLFIGSLTMIWIYKPRQLNLEKQ